MKLGWRILVLGAALGGVGLCAYERVRGRGAPAATRSSARAFGMFSPTLPDNLADEARAALERDARRREQRFVDAARPGHLWEATRVSQDEIERGAFGPDTLFELGAQLFHHHFRREEGFGGRDLPPLGRVHRGRRGGPDAYGCHDCHRRGGPAGAGDAADNAYLEGDGETPASALERNAPSLTGAGLVELCAREMTAELARRRDALVREARRLGRRLTTPLEAKGVSFGRLGAGPDGTLDAGSVEGVDHDLVIKPFGWKGHAATLRDVVEDELALHHGMQSDALVASGSAERIGHFGGLDPDGDGVTGEIGEGQVSVLTLFVAMQEVPEIGMPRASDDVQRWSEGKRMFEKLGCAGCHVASLPLDATVYELPSRTGGAPVRVDLALAGADPRIARPREGGPYRLHLYSDLKRHDMGPALAEPRPYRGVDGRLFLTPRLWGLARSRPYLHDARAPTFEDAILAHGGEGQSARDAYAALDRDERAPLRIYLTSLTRARRLVSP
jgi:mono/diheme cytochrome c family protein